MCIAGVCIACMGCIKGKRIKMKKEGKPATLSSDGAETEQDRMEKSGEMYDGITRIMILEKLVRVAAVAVIVVTT